MASDDKEISNAFESCQNKIKQLKSSIEQLKAKTDIKILQSITKDSNLIQNTPRLNLSVYQELSHHNAKISAICWSQREYKLRLLSASQDGKMHFYDISDGELLTGMSLRSGWPMACAVSPSGGVIASGGLDHVLTIINAENVQNISEIEGHQQYISSMEFVDDNHIITGSGDETCKLWDIQKSKCIQTFVDYELLKNKDQGRDVSDVAVNVEKSLLIASSVDGYAYLYDYRMESDTKPIAVFKGHLSDIECVSWFPGNICFVTGGDDSCIRLWDIRSYCTLNVFEHESIYCIVSSVDCSNSGYYIFGSYDDNPWCVAWNTLNGQREATYRHPQKCTAIKLSPQGNLFATGCWDKKVRIYANIEYENNGKCNCFC